MRDGRRASCVTTAIRVSEENGRTVVIVHIKQDGLLNILQSKRTRNCSICGILVSRNRRHRFPSLFSIKFLMHALFLEDKLIIRNRK